MKTKISTLLLISSFVLSSCIDDFHGNGGNEDDIELTEKNYVYEGHLYQQYLSKEIKQSEVRRAEIIQIMDNNQGTPELKEELQKVEEAIVYFGGEFSSVLDPETFGIAPRPRPCPEEDILKDLCIPREWVKILGEERADIRMSVGNNTGGEQYHNWDDHETKHVPGLEGEFEVQCNEQLRGLSGPLNISVDRNDRFGNRVSYEL